MITAKNDLQIYRGSTESLVFEFDNPDGTPVDVTGYTAKLQLRRTRDEAAATEFEIASTAATATEVFQFCIGPDGLFY